MKRSFPYNLRKSHRYLGLVTGLQFLLWTLGGLYFSWSNIEEIHGDFERKPPSFFKADFSLISPDTVIRQLAALDSVKSIQLIDLLGQPHYQVVYFTGEQGKVAERTQLAHAATGLMRASLSREEAVAVARSRFKGAGEVTETAYLAAADLDGHHEYRGSPLPAWAIRMEHPSRTTVYVAAEQGTVTKFRNDKWRVFDFLWMLHTMDYQTRDHFGNLLLRLFSVLGLITILSGLGLYFVSSPSRRKAVRALRGNSL
ncbi:hypothetical protein BH24BAC1_BH24BAC1_22610 [soil metagenome]|jgi:uncharacterized iron-regulated membrane protein